MVWYISVDQLIAIEDFLGGEGSIYHVRLKTMALPAKHDWTPIRESYIMDLPRPSYADLSERFSCPIGTLTRVATDEGWVSLRSARLEQLALKSDSLEVILRAAKTETEVIGVARDVALGIFSALLKALNNLELDKDAKPRACMDLANTASFALQNVANACHRFGIVGLPDGLRKAASGTPDAPGNGQWDKALLQQINLTVNTLQAKATERAGPDLSPIGQMPAAGESLDIEKPVTK